MLLSVTVGELMLPPVTLSFLAKVAPSTFKTQMVTLSLLGFSLGFALGGVLLKTYYRADALLSFFQLLYGIGVASGAVLLPPVPVLNQMLKGAD